jgi:hypothetical protein
MPSLKLASASKEEGDERGDNFVCISAPLPPREMLLIERFGDVVIG